MIPGTEISHPSEAAVGLGPFQTWAPSQVGMYGVEAQGVFIVVFGFVLPFQDLSVYYPHWVFVAAQAVSSGAEHGPLFIVVRGLSRAQAQ